MSETKLISAITETKLHITLIEKNYESYQKAYYTEELAKIIYKEVLQILNNRLKQLQNSLNEKENK